jgi:glycosyltransferase involved in cell wall biosynthesis
LILAFGTYDAERHPRAQILVDGLRARGVDVVEANRPLGLSTAQRVRMLQQPWRLPSLAVRLARSWALLARDARRVVRRHGAPDAVLVGYLGHFDVLLARALFRHTTIVLDHLVFAADTAVDRGARGLRVRLLAGLDRLALGRCDVAVVDTEEHRAMLADLVDPARGVVVPVGATSAWFEAGAAARASGGAAGDGPRPVRIVFFGLFTPLQGAVVIARALACLLSERPEVEVTMIGSGQDLDAARAALAGHGTAGQGSVTWTAWVEPAELPAIVAAHDVCLGIFGGTPKARRVVPNKVYQGLAAGCAVVTSDTAPQRRVVGDVTELVPPDDPDALAAALRGLVDDPRRLRALREVSGSGVSSGGGPGRAPRFSAAEVVGPLVERLGLGVPA